MNRLVFTLVFLVSFCGHLSATELKGSPEELKRFLHPNQNIVTLRGEGKETAFSDEAIIYPLSMKMQVSMFS